MFAKSSQVRYCKILNDFLERTYEFNTIAGGYIFFSRFSDFFYASVRR